MKLMVKTLYAPPAASLINIALRENAAINLPRMFVGLRGFVAFLRRNLRRLLAPTLVDGLQAPFGATARGADRLVADDDEDRVGVRRSQDAQRHPTAALDLEVERYFARRAVGGDLLFIHRRSINDQFDRHFARPSSARAFQIPVRLLVVAQFADRFVRLFIQPRGHARRYAYSLRPIQLHLTSPRPDRQVVDLKIYQVALAVRNVCAPVAHAFGPPVVGQLVELDVAAAQPHALAVDAREIGLAADARTEACVERVVPDVQFPRRGRVDGRDEIYGVMRHVDDVFVRADSVETRQFVIGEGVALRLQAPARMREAGDRALALRPLQDRQIPRRPIFQDLDAGIVLFFQSQQDEVAAMRRREARNLEVVTHQVLARRELVVFGLEELFLEVITRPPGQHAADVERLAQNVADHVLRHHALRRAFVMHAPGGVDVMIARIPAELRDVDPPFEFERQRLRLVYFDRLAFGDVLRPARVFDRVFARR